MSLSSWIILGLGLGVLVGLFFGEPAAVLQPIADVYIRLMQMTVLPYLVMALIIGFGQLEADQAKRLALKGGALLLVTWLFAGLVIAGMAAAFPDMQNASFFSHSLVEPKQSFSIVDLYFTANPFHSLSNAVVPAIVLFSSMIGIGLIGLEDKERVLETLRAFNGSIVRITKFIVSLTPIGVFALSAVTAGTMSGATLERLEVYFITFAAASLLLAFWVLPLLVTAATPFRYREVVGTARAALLTAFVANNAFIVLPILIERSKALLKEHGMLNSESDSAAEILIPVLFNFPNAGRLLTLLFVPFAAWMAGSSLSEADFGALFAVGVPSYFAKAQVALPFLMDFFELPHDLFQLYVPTTILTGKFDSMVTAMNLLVFALLGAGAMGGFLVLQRKRLIAAGVSIVAGIAVTVVAVGMLLDLMVDTSYHRDEALRRMHTPQNLSTAVVHRDLSTVHQHPAPQDASTLDRVLEHGTLRVGYDPANVPFSFFNLDDELVGFDIELAKSLADSLDVKAEFVPIEWHALPEMLSSRMIDIMPSVWYRPYWFPSLRLSAPYLVGTMALAVRDDRRHEFGSVEALRNSKDLKIGIPLNIRQIQYSLKRYFEGSNAQFVTIESWQPFFEGRHPELDAFLVPAENGAAWSLLHPEYTVVVPQPDPVKVPSAFGVALDASELVDAANEWIVFATNEGTIQRAYDYWVLGKGAEDTTPRWSIMRNVLGWVD